MFIRIHRSVYIKLGDLGIMRANHKHHSSSMPELLMLLMLPSLFCSCDPAFWGGMAQGMQAANAARSTSYSSYSSQAKFCPSCRMQMYFTGDTEMEWGKLLYKYRCPAGHEYWYPSSVATSNSYAKHPCAICGMESYFLGETKVEFGVLLKIYECPAGHKSVKRF